jgi:hypothetical protein
MAQSQPRVVNLNIDLRSTTEVLGIVILLALIVYMDVRRGRPDLLTWSNYGFGFLSIGGIFLYLVIVGALTRRYLFHATGLKTIVIGLIVVPSGIVIMFMTSASATFRGPLLMLVFLSSLVTLTYDRNIRDGMFSLICSVGSCGVLFGGFLGTSTSDLMRTAAGPVSIGLTTSYWASVFGIDAPILWLTGAGFSHGIHVITVLIGAVSYYISRAQLATE